MKKDDIKPFITLIKYILVFLAIITIYIILLVQSSSYPKRIDEIVKHRITVSVNNLYENEKEYDSFFTNYYNGRLGNYADSIMMHIIYNSGIGSKLEWAIGAPIYGDTYAASQLQELYDTVNGNQSGEIVYYSRYWHGYRIWLKFLFIFFDYQQIRLFNAFVFYMMLFACMAYIYKKINWQASMSFLVSIIFVNITLIPMSINYLNVYIISFLTIILLVNSYISESRNLGLLFFITGSITMFFDFYTYPYLTLGYPLATIIFYSAAKDKKTTLELFRIAIKCSLLWTFGYLLTWCANILLVRIIFGAEEMAIARTVVATRLSNNGEPTIGFFVHAIKSIISMFKEMLQPPNGHLYAAFIIIWALLFPFYKKKEFINKRYLSLLVIVIFIFVWFGVAPSPAIYFQYKGIALYIFLFTYLLLNSIDCMKILKKIKKTDENNTKIEKM